MNHHPSHRVLFFVCWLVGAAAWGQTPDSRIEQARLRAGTVGPNPGTEGDIPQRAVATPGDADLGVQWISQPKERAHPWRLFASASDYYTDNVALAKSNRQADGYFFTEVGARYERKLTEALGIEATVRQGLFRYHEVSAQNFNSLNAGTGLYYEMKELWDITVFGRYNFERLTDENLGHEFLRNHTLTAGAQKTFALAGGNSIYLGYASIFGFAEQAAAQRNEHTLYAGGQAHLTKMLDADLYARLALFDYRQGSRRDFNGTVVAALTYRLNKRLAVSASYSFVFDRSNRSRFDYDAGTTGGGLTFRYEF